MSLKNDFKSSLNLPKTDFPMKGNLPTREPLQVQKWNEKSIYKKLERKNSQKQDQFFLLDGPPYSNGDIHLGHVLNKILKDITIKYKNLAGEYSPFIPCWDCHGLPIEMKAIKRLEKDKRESLPEKTIRQECRKEALHWVKRQMEAFQRLGVLADWDARVLTLSPEYEAEELRVFADIVDRGYIYRGKKPVFWCSKLQTAVAFSEAVYRNHKSPSLFAKFPATEEMKQQLNHASNLSVCIWTTTPWSLVGNSAICLNENFEYGIFEFQGESLILATKLEKQFEEQVGVSLKRKQTFRGKELEGLNTQHPFLDRLSPIVLGDHVTLDAGTGCVHTAPGHGLEDFAIGQAYQLELRSPIDDRGCFNGESPEALRNLSVLGKGNQAVIDILKDRGQWIQSKEIEHSYPYNPRSNSPLIYRLTPQWFLKLDHDFLKPEAKRSKTSLREKIQADIRHSMDFNQKIHKPKDTLPHSSNKVKSQTTPPQFRFLPSWGADRLLAMVKHSPDWCLSRQRVWGVPIPVFYCEDCSEPLLDSKLIRHIANQMDSSKDGIEFYFSRSASALLLKTTTCKKCRGASFRKGTDILDVWFDSGIQHRYFKKHFQFHLPIDLFLEGSDQHRGWFQTSLISSVAVDGNPPFKTLLTHGFVNDAEGRKMSKSQGTGVDPLKLMEKRGAEVLRLWVASEDYSQDIDVKEESFERVSETYRRFRNTFRFLLGNLNDFDPQTMSLKTKDLHPIDRWALFQLNALIRNCKEAYQDFLFHKAYHSLNHFFQVTLSSFYLDIIKDRLYTWRADSKARRSTQTTLYYMMTELMKLMSPITSFLSEEVLSHVPWVIKEESVFLFDFPKENQDWNDAPLSLAVEFLLNLRSSLQKQIEELRKKKTVGSSLEVKVLLSLKNGDLVKGFSHYDLLEIFGISQLEIQDEAKENAVHSKKALGEKCPRCWFWVETLTDQKICNKCVENL